ncbi:hypothetical protein LCGC14_1209490, partial [marine sediment metagenome]
MKLILHLVSCLARRQIHKLLDRQLNIAEFKEIS